MSTKLSLTLLVFLALTLITTAQNAEIKHIPQTVEAEVGESFTVNVMLNLMENPVSVVDMFMNYDPEILEVQGISISQEGLFHFHMPPAYNNENGKIKMSAFQLENSLPEGEFAFVEIEFLALQPTDLTEVTHSQNGSVNTMLAYAGAKVNADVSTLEIIITEANPLSDGVLSEGEYSLELWPNPATEYAIVTLRLPIDERVTINLYDSQGKLVKSIFEGMVYASASSHFDLDLENLADGVYALEFYMGNQIHTEKLMIAK